MHSLASFIFIFHYYRRVEDHMRPLVQSAMRASAATERKERKAAVASFSSTKKTPNNKSQQQRQPSSPPPPSSNARKNSKAYLKDAPSSAAARRKNDDDDDDHRPKEFAVISSAAPRNLNDIAMAPPALNKFPRGVKTKHCSLAAGGGGKAKAGAGAGVLSMAQRVMMEVERESAIKRYREMKERKTKETDRTPLIV